MRKINKQLNLSINYIENHYKIMQAIEMNMKVFVIFLLNMLMKTNKDFFYKHEYKNKIKLFQS